MTDKDVERLRKYITLIRKASMMEWNTIKDYGYDSDEHKRVKRVGDYLQIRIAREFKK